MVTMKFIIYCLTAVVCTWTAAAESVSQPLARLSKVGEIISEQDLAAYLDVRIGLRAVARNVPGIEQVVREMAWNRVLNLEGERLAIARTGNSEEIPSRFDDMYALSVEKKQEPVCKRPENEQQARQYFDANPQAFIVPAQARIQRIMLSRATQIAGQSATDWLQAQAKAVAVGTPFAEVAQQAEQIEALELQGDLGWVSLDEEHAVLNALRAAKEGEIVGPLQEGDFVYLFQIMRKRPARPLTWEEAKPFAATRAETHCRESGQEQLRTSLFQKYGVEIDTAAIRTFFVGTLDRKK